MWIADAVGMEINGSDRFSSLARCECQRKCRQVDFEVTKDRNLVSQSNDEMMPAGKPKEIAQEREHHHLRPKQTG